MASFGRGMFVVLTAAILGAVAVRNQQIAFVLLAILVGTFAVAISPSAWVGLAIFSVVGLRGAITLGAVPSVVTYIDIPLVWVALAVSLIRANAMSALARKHLMAVGAFGLSVLLSWLLNPSELLRPIVYFALLAEPFALVGALLITPPTPRACRNLKILAGLLILVQVPIDLFQAAHYGSGDSVQGTFYGAGAGAHEMGAIVALGALWLLVIGRRMLLWRICASAVLLGLVFLADAKQIILAFPGVLFAAHRGVLRKALAPIAVVTLCVGAFLLAPELNKGYGLRVMDQATSGAGGKDAVGRYVWRSISQDPASILFGLGPAETVSRAAFLTTPLLQRTGSPLEVLHLRPAPMAIQAQVVAVASSGGGSSINSGVSSAIGVFGDIGLMGFGAYLYVWIQLLLALRKRTSGESLVAAAGIGMLFILGVVFDWWEEPPFTLFVALFISVALTQNQTERIQPPLGSTRSPAPAVGGER